MDEERINLALQILESQRNSFANEAVNLRVEVGVRDRQIQMLKDQILEMTPKKKVVVDGPLERGT